MSIISKILKAGAFSHLPFYEQERIKKLNRLYLLSFPGCLIPSFIGYDSFPFVMITMLIPLLLIIAIGFHYKGWYNFANIFVVITFNTLCTILAIGFDGATFSENYLLLSIFSINIQYHFKKKTTKELLWIFTFSLYLLIHIVNYFPHPTFESPKYIASVYFYNLGEIIFFIMFLMRDYHTLIEHYQVVIGEQNEVLSSQKYALQESNQMKDRLLSIIGHDLSKPLASIKGMFMLIMQKLLSAKEEEKYLNQLLSLIDSTNLTLRNLLEWGTQQNTQEIKEKLDVYEYVEQNISLFQSMADQKNINIVSHIPPQTYVFTNKYHLSFIIRNLINNAIKFTHIGGNISIFIEENVQQFVIYVKDNGVGISPQHLSKLFDFKSGFTTHGTASESGTGLGLPLCKQFIESNGGTINITSEVGKGSTFSFSIPK